MIEYRTYFRRFATTVAVVLVALFLFELAGRAAFATLGIDVASLVPARNTTGESTEKFTPHPFLPYSGNPNAGSGNRRNNSLGFRGKEFVKDKPENVYRILAFGGSTTYSTGTSGLPPWPELLETKLNNSGSGTRFEVYNFAVVGGCSPFSLVNLSLHGVHYNPDMVIEYHGHNDSWTFGLSSFRTDYSHCLRNYEPNAEQMGFRFFAPSWIFNSQIATYGLYLLDKNYGFFDRGTIWHQVFKDCDLPQDTDPFHGVEALLANIRTMKGIAAEYGSDFIGSTYLFRDFTDAELNQHLRDFFIAEKIEYVDIEKLAPVSREDLLMDDVHFTLKGADVVAQLFSERVLQIQAEKQNRAQTGSSRIN